MQIVVSDGVLIAIIVAGLVGYAIYKNVPIKVWKTLSGFGVQTNPARSKPQSRRRQKPDEPA